MKLQSQNAASMKEPIQTQDSRADFLAENGTAAGMIEREKPEKVR